MSTATASNAAPDTTEAASIQEDYSSHPLWETQVELERGMLRDAAQHYQARVTEAQTKKRMTRLDAVRSLLEDWLPPVVDGLKIWIKATKTSRGPKPIALEYLKDSDHGAVCLIALRTILDQLTLSRPALTALFCEIGQEVEHECQVRLWEQEEPDLFYAQQKDFERAHSNAPHQRRVNINRFNSLLNTGKFGFGWTSWTNEVHFHLGKHSVDNIVRATRWFDYISDPTFIRKGKTGAALVLAPKPELTEWVGKQLGSESALTPSFKPTVIPPKRWIGTRSGGYHTPYVKTPRLIRFKAHQEDQKDRAADEYDALAMPNVYNALHFVQETGWRVNSRVLEVAKVIKERDLAIAGVPLLNPLDLPPQPADIETNEEARKRWKQAAASVYSKNALALAHTRSFNRTFEIATEYSAFERMYFPHMLDFRGRMYPIPVGLNPQGDDLARGLLEFADGKPVTQDSGGAGWLAIQVSSMWGGSVDKMSFDDRIAWVEEREDLWRSIAADPLGEQDWATTDKPFQCLAAIFEWVSFLDTGMGFVSHLPVVVDGTCNGIQHLSAMTLDAEAGEHVNLTPSDKPKDIYKYVADSLQEVLERLEATACGLPAEHASYWLNLCGRDLPRTLTKRPVMVLPYGGTKDAYFLYTRKWLDEKAPLPQHATDEERTTRTSRLAFIVHHLWEVVKVKVSGGRVVMDWLKLCAVEVSSLNQPIVWVPHSGFVVRHFYGKRIFKTMATKLDGHRVDLELAHITKDLDRKSQLLGISPNFVHSQDAAALTMSIIRSINEGTITSFTAVHDAYGTHAADMWELARHLREAFVELHSEDALLQFRNACLSMLVGKMVESEGLDPDVAAEKADDRLPRLPPKGTLDLNKVKESDYFFA